MACCLGITTENKLIKYAKVTKTRDEIKVDAYGVKTYEDLETVIQQIVEETDSKHLPININLAEEIYSKFNLFSGLNKKDIKAMLNSEFELLCEERGYTYNALESNYIVSRDFLNKEVLNAIYISASKGDMLGKIQKMQGYNIENSVPTPIALLNLVNRNIEKNFVIINIEDRTTATVVVNGEVSDVITVDLGMKDILDKINVKVNSYSKAYEACKATTIYTSKNIDAPLEGTDYLDDIVPTLFNIINEVKNGLKDTVVTLNKVYVTGTVTAINNVDFYFQDYFQSAKCEILAPGFIDKSALNINVRDYVEVNSALAVAMQGLGEGYQETNFKNIYTNTTPLQKLKSVLGQKIDADTFKKLKDIRFETSFSGPLSAVEVVIARIGSTFAICTVLYVIVTLSLVSSIEQKEAITQRTIEDTKATISTIDANITKVNNKISEYSTRITKLENINAAIIAEYKYRKAIPNLLTQIMSIIPEGVQVTSIENTSDDNIVICAQANRYEELAYFKVKLKSDNVLLNVTSDSGVKQDAVIKITIEGNLP